jgi:hypothetical protein
MSTDYLARPVYRMIHIDNVEYVLKNGMCTRAHESADPAYINIGDTQLIAQREDFSVRINPPGGKLSDYVPFYFAGHSPMLYNIKTGWRGIRQRPQAEIVFLASSIGRIIQRCSLWCYTDGHAKHNISGFYNNVNALSQLDWDTIRSQYWNNTLDDMDRQRRKAAEFLVKDFVPEECIKEIYVFNEACRVRVQLIANQLNVDIPVIIDKDKKLYFP